MLYRKYKGLRGKHGEADGNDKGTRNGLRGLYRRRGKDGKLLSESRLKVQDTDDLP